jgi:diaminopimelate decarboxylase
MNLPAVLDFRHGQLHCEDLSLATIAAQIGTPVYVYSQAELEGRAEAVLRAAGQIVAKPLVCYAVKANGNPSIMRLLARAGLGADVTSGGELYLAGHAGFRPQDTVFSGVGKSAAEISMALAAGIRALHVESSMELEVIAAIACRRQQVAAISVRVNPDIAADTHPHISTGRQAHKFGVLPEQALAMLRTAAEHPWLRPVGLAAHIGSQITDLAPFSEAAEALCALADQIQQEGVTLDYLDVGGGLGIIYREVHAPALEDWVAAVARPVAAAGYDLVLEPGRSIVGPSGLLLTQVLYTKNQGGRHFVITDAGMSDLIRPALYDAYHPILPIEESSQDPTMIADIVGPVCETGDTLARDRALPNLQTGAVLAILQAGAYGFAMSSNYNGRLKPAEVLVSGSDFRLIRQRQQLEDLLAGTVD